MVEHVGTDVFFGAPWAIRWTDFNGADHYAEFSGTRSEAWHSFCRSLGSRVPAAVSISQSVPSPEDPNWEPRWPGDRDKCRVDQEPVDFRYPGYGR